MRRMKGKLFLWGFAILVALEGNAQTGIRQNGFSLEQALAYSKKNNLQVKNALLNVEVQKQQNRGITSAALPNIGGNVSSTHYIDIPTQVIPASAFGGPPGEYIPVQFSLKNSASVGLQLQQLLFDGQVFVGLQARKASIEFQEKNLAITEEAIKANVTKIYYQLVAGKTQLQMIDANITRLQLLQKEAKELYKTGFAEKLDVDKIIVQVTNLQTQRLSVANSIEIGYLGLKTLMGMPVKENLVLTDTISESKLKDGPTKETAYNYSDRKEYQYGSLGKKLNEFNVRRYKLAYLPSIAFGAAYAKQAYRPKFDFFNKGDWFPATYVSLNINVPIFDGFAKDAKLKQAQIELKETENSLENLRNTIDNEVIQASMNYRSAIATLDFQKQNMRLAEDVFAQTKKKYQAGTGSNTEMTAANTDLITAQTNYINALYGAIVAKVDFQKAIGKL